MEDWIDGDFVLRPDWFMGGRGVMPEYRIKVQSDEAGVASRQAQSLERTLRELELDADVRRVKEDQTTMDGGAVIAVVLASPVLLELAHALRVFVERYHSSSITISEDGHVVAQNISAANVMELAKVFPKKT